MKKGWTGIVFQFLYSSNCELTDQGVKEHALIIMAMFWIFGCIFQWFHWTAFSHAIVERHHRSTHCLKIAYGFQAEFQARIGSLIWTEFSWEPRIVPHLLVALFPVKSSIWYTHLSVYQRISRKSARSSFEHNYEISERCFIVLFVTRGQKESVQITSKWWLKISPISDVRLPWSKDDN